VRIKGGDGGKLEARSTKKCFISQVGIRWGKSLFSCFDSERLAEFENCEASDTREYSFVNWRREQDSVADHKKDRGRTLTQKSVVVG